uniref:Myb/SANT-like domain-containing protein n=1 Tax=Lactuca sativa TaxID=4236 RepID=A0A9R1XMQ4_LACSA|nr:hypothetical protein LSAT_V11C200062260 [Lactuca sativa]
MDTNNVNLVDDETSKYKLNPKLIWDNHTFMIFLEECMNEDKKGNIAGKSFYKKNINERMGKMLEIKQLKNKCDTMRKEWKLYDRSMKLESGISYDSMRKIIIASPEWWEEKIKGDKDYAKFRDKNFEIYETYYEKLFRDLVL